MSATAQEPIGSGFGAESTTADVIEGIDLSGKLAVVTGGYSGIGIETVRALVGAGADVVVPARRPEHAEGELSGIDRATVIPLDLADLESVKAAADSLLADEREIDILINNAAIMAAPETRVGPGWEAQFATNHLGHFALTVRLWPLLASGGARVVALSSAGHRRSPVRFDDLMFERDEYERWAAYGQAKSANSLFAVQLDALGQGAGVRAFAVHPGGIATPLQRYMTAEEQARTLAEFESNPDLRLKSPQQGAATSVWAATSPSLDGMGGVYCEDCDIAPRKAPDAQDARDGVSAWAIDPEAAERLWQVSAELTGVDAFA